MALGRFRRIADERRQRSRKILVFISTGDTCRAPMAAGYFRKLLEDNGVTNIEVRDAGILTVAGLRATSEAIQILDTVDVDLRRHSSRKLSNEAIKRADLILGMSSIHVQTALRQSEHARGKTFLLKEFVGWEQKNVQIQDPMGGTLEIYKKCFQEIKETCDRLLESSFVQSRPDAEGAGQPAPTQQAPAAKAVEEAPPEPTPAPRKPKPKTPPKPKAKAERPPKAAPKKAAKASAKKTAAKPARKKPAKVAAKKAAKKTIKRTARKAAKKKVAPKPAPKKPARKAAKKAAKKKVAKARPRALTKPARKAAKKASQKKASRKKGAAKKAASKKTAFKKRAKAAKKTRKK